MAAFRRNPFGSAPIDAGTKAKLELAGPFEAQRLKSEVKLLSLVEQALTDQWRAVQRRLRGQKAFDDELGMLPDDEAFWSAQRQEFVRTLGTLPEDLMLRGVAEAGQLGLNIDWHLANEQVRVFADDYMNEWWRQLDRTTRSDMRKAFVEHIQDGTTQRQLRDKLTPLFGKVRADMIAVTETTRLYAEGNAVGYAAAGVKQVEWRTVFDERVCPICMSRSGKRYPVGSPEGMPPGHVKCRCFISPVVGRQARNKPVEKPPEQTAGQQIVQQPAFGQTPKLVDNWMNGKIDDLDEFGGGINLTLKGNINGRNVVIKPQPSKSGGRLRDSIPAGHDVERERAAYLVNKNMGEMVRMPEVIMRDISLEDVQPGSKFLLRSHGLPEKGNHHSAVQEFLEDATKGANHKFGPGSGIQPHLNVMSQEDMHHMGVFDALIGNLDRHPGNWMFRRTAAGDDLELWAIDHGLAFPEGLHPLARRSGNTYVQDWVAEPTHNMRGLSVDETRMLRQLKARHDEFGPELEQLVGKEAADGVWARLDAMLESGMVIPG